jgi:UDP-2,3-diacylglucosamine pyrophosphatase LpxH
VRKTFILIISDIHLEMDECQAELLLKILQTWEFEILIINGDLHKPGYPLGQAQARLAEFLKTIKRKVVCVHGNHDRKWFLKNILGMRAVKRFKTKLGGKIICIRHGHEFERFWFLFNDEFIDRIFDGVIWFLKKIDPKQRHVGGLINWLHRACLSHDFANKAIKWAKRHGIDLIVCGHVHYAQKIIRILPKGRVIEYFNSSDWVSEICSFITLEKNGVAELHHVEVVSQTKTASLS